MTCCRKNLTGMMRRQLPEPASAAEQPIEHIHEAMPELPAADEPPQPASR